MKNRSERRHNTERIIQNRLGLIKQLPSCNGPVRLSLTPDGRNYYDHCVEKPHRLAKKHPLDCGRPKCKVCHMEKNAPRGMAKAKRRVMQEIRMEIDESFGE